MPGKTRPNQGKAGNLLKRYLLQPCKLMVSAHDDAASTFRERFLCKFRNPICLTQLTNGEVHFAALNGFGEFPPIKFTKAD